MTNYNAVADQYGFVVAYPDRIDLSPGPTATRGAIGARTAKV